MNLPSPHPQPAVPYFPYYVDSPVRPHAVPHPPHAGVTRITPYDMGPPAFGVPWPHALPPVPHPHFGYHPPIPIPMPFPPPFMAAPIPYGAFAPNPYDHRRRRMSVPSRTYERISSPTSGKLFGSGSSGPQAPSDSPKRMPHEAKGPYTSDDLPTGPVPVPVFKSTEEAYRDYDELKKRLATKMSRPKSNRRASDMNLIWGRGANGPDLGFVDRSAELGERGPSSVLALVDVDKDKEPWQVKQQVWQRPEHAKSLYGLCPALTPAEVKGVPVVRTSINWMLHCRIIWDISEPPSTALWSTPLQAPAPLTSEQLNSLAVQPPEPVMHLLFGRWSRDRKEAIITIQGSDGVVTVGNVLSGIYRFVSKQVVFVEDGLVEVPKSHPEGKRKSLKNKSHSTGERRSSLARVEGNASNSRPLWFYMGEPKYFGGIRWHKSLIHRMGEEYWDLRNLWLIDFTSSRPEPLPVEKRRNSDGPDILYNF